MIETILTSLATALITGFVTFSVQERKLKSELRTEFMAEQVAKTLLENEKWKKRSFTEIQKRLGGFEDNDLRRILVRAGAVRFLVKNENEIDKEMWGLLSRNQDIV